ncbi:MAG: OmpA family protein [Elusimicrobia bacterium]|nr:OmpA family protein [Elusimicrobiota bacterium]
MTAATLAETTVPAAIPPTTTSVATAPAPVVETTPVQESSQPPVFQNTPKAYFAFNKFVLNDTSKETLNAVAQKLQNAGNMDILIIGHTDSVGSAAYNQKLSEKRAKEVYTYLTNKGIKVHSMRYYGMGKTQPAATNATSAGRAKNRRVEIMELPVPSV